MTHAADPTVVVKHLSVSFNGRDVLHEVGFALWPGRLTVLVGPSGSGKSTLLRAVNRLNEVFPACRTRGSVSVRLGGSRHEIYEDMLPLSDLRRGVGMVFQIPTVLPASIAKNLSMPLRVTLGLKGRDVEERSRWALGEVSLWEEVKDRLHHDATTLSGGQQQRLCLARILALEPEILLLDEPTASLDFKAAARIEQLLLELKQRYTIFMVSHSLRQAQRLADQLLVLRDGSISLKLDEKQLKAPDALQRMIEEAF